MRKKTVAGVHKIFCTVFFCNSRKTFLAFLIVLISKECFSSLKSPFLAFWERLLGEYCKRMIMRIVKGLFFTSLNGSPDWLLAVCYHVSSMKKFQLQKIFAKVLVRFCFQGSVSNFQIQSSN